MQGQSYNLLFYVPKLYKHMNTDLGATGHLLFQFEYPTSTELKRNKFNNVPPSQDAPPSDLSPQLRRYADKVPMSLRNHVLLLSNHGVHNQFPRWPSRSLQPCVLLSTRFLPFKLTARLTGTVDARQQRLDGTSMVKSPTTLSSPPPTTPSFPIFYLSSSSFSFLFFPNSMR